MAAVIIRKKAIERFGEKLKQKIFNFLHDESLLTTFESMRVQQEKFRKKLIVNHFNTLHRQFLITEEKRQELYEKFNDSLPLKITSMDGKDESYVKEDEDKYVKDAMKLNGVDIEGLYHMLISLNISIELNEDLYFEIKAYLYIFRVFIISYTYLDDD